MLRNATVSGHLVKFSLPARHFSDYKETDFACKPTIPNHEGCSLPLENVHIHEVGSILTMLLNCVKIPKDYAKHASCSNCTYIRGLNAFPILCLSELCGSAIARPQVFEGTNCCWHAVCRLHKGCVLACV